MPLALGGTESADSESESGDSDLVVRLLGVLSATLILSKNSPVLDCEPSAPLQHSKRPKPQIGRNGGGSFAPSPQGSLCKLSPQRFICPTPIGVGRPMLWGNSVQKMEKLVVLGLVSPKVFICKVLRQPSIVLQMGIPCPLELT